MRNSYTYFFMSILLLLAACTALVGVLAWAQKAEKVTESRGRTLADLGVTREQTDRIKALWELKRKNHIQAIENLRPLNRLAKDLIASDDDIRETLKKFRQNLLEQENKIQSVEEKLIEDLPPRAQLHLTILGVLENGLVPRRFRAASPKDKKGASVEK